MPLLRAVEQPNMVGADLGEAAAADAAAHQAGEQVARPPPIPERRLVAVRRRACVVECACRAFTACQSSSSTMRSSGHLDHDPARSAGWAATRACRCSGP